MNSQTLPSYDSLSRPLPIWHPKAIYYSLVRLLFQTIGQLSDGIRLGLKYGFDSGVMLEYVYRNRPSGIRDFQKINYSFSRIIIILGVWEVGIDGCPLLPIL